MFKSIVFVIMLVCASLAQAKGSSDQNVPVHDYSAKSCWYKPQNEMRWVNLSAATTITVRAPDRKIVIRFSHRDEIVLPAEQEAAITNQMTSCFRELKS